MVHVVNTYTSSNQRENDRMSRARKTWNQIPLLMIRDDELARNSKTEFGDKKGMPFVRDLVELGFDTGAETVILTNADSCLVRDIKEYILGDTPATSRRVNLMKIPRIHYSRASLGHDGFHGIDLIVIPKWWWKEAKYPDLLMGYEGWDWVFRFMINNPIEPPIVYHEYHYEAYWVSCNDRGTLWNKYLCRKWAAASGRWDEISRFWDRLAGYPESFDSHETKYPQNHHPDREGQRSSDSGFGNAGGVLPVHRNPLNGI
jgi:hypothetical protein